MNDLIAVAQEPKRIMIDGVEVVVHSPSIVRLTKIAVAIFSVIQTTGSFKEVSEFVAKVRAEDDPVERDKQLIQVILKVLGSFNSATVNVLKLICTPRGQDALVPEPLNLDSFWLERASVSDICALVIAFLEVADVERWEKNGLRLKRMLGKNSPGAN